MTIGEGTELGHIDPDVQVGYGSDRVASQEVALGPSPRLRSGTVIYGGARIGARFSTGHHVVIREQVTIGDDVCVWSNTVLDYGCVLGDGVKVHANAYVAQHSLLEAGVFLAPGVTLANDLYPGQPRSAALMTGPTLRAGAQIGCNATVLPFVTIGARAIIGAGAVVTRDVPADSVAYGCPAVAVGSVHELTDVDARVELLAGDASRYRFRGDGGHRG